MNNKPQVFPKQSFGRCLTGRRNQPKQSPPQGMGEETWFRVFAQMRHIANRELSPMEQEWLNKPIARDLGPRVDFRCA